jgi:hypothetical protein
MCSCVCSIATAQLTLTGLRQAENLGTAQLPVLVQYMVSRFYSMSGGGRMRCGQQQTSSTSSTNSCRGNTSSNGGQVDMQLPTTNVRSLVCGVTSRHSSSMSLVKDGGYVLCSMPFEATLLTSHP